MSDRHSPKPDCKFCQGKGERPIKRRPSELTPCICTYVDHEFSDFAGDSLAELAKKELAKLDYRELKRQAKKGKVKRAK